MGIFTPSSSFSQAPAPSHQGPWVAQEHLHSWSQISAHVQGPMPRQVKNLPAVQEMRVRSLSWENPLEEEMATHSSIPAWEISWTEEPGGLQSMGL